MKRLVSIGGTVLALGVLAALMWRAAPDLPALDLASPVVWGATLLALISYVGSQVFAAESWRLILSSLQMWPTPSQARSQFLVSQVGKYVPGNVAHLFGRVVLARADGLAPLTVSLAMLIEVALTLGLGLALVCGILMLQPDMIADILAAYPDVGGRLGPVALGVALILGLCLGGLMVRARWGKASGPAPRIAQLAGPVLLLLGSLSVLGLSLWAVSQAIAPGMAVDVLTCTVIFTVAWILGFVVPGAPGGIGIRDSVIALGLSAALGMGPALGVALLHRVVSVAGDGCTFAVGVWLRKRSAAPKSSQPRPISAAENG